MTLLLPLGILGLVSLAVLILIYILRPNYQQKLVSTTFIWKLSLKYKKNRIPISKLRNLLILCCQILLLVSLALMMAQPVIRIYAGVSQNEKIAIIDASASMMVASDNETRFERAIKEVKQLSNSVFSYDDGILSVIIADSDAHFLVSRLTAEDAGQIDEKLNALSANTDCSFGSADLDGAASLAEDILATNSQAEVIFYTATNYLDHGSFKVVDVSADDDWNAAILEVTPVLEESNTYSFSVKAGCYGVSKAMTITCDLIGANGNAAAVTRTATKTEYFTDLEPEKTITFTSTDFSGSGESIYSFAEMYVHVDEADSMQRDNTFNVYGGTKQTIRIQYASSAANNFYSGALRYLRQSMKNTWNIEIDETAPSQAKTEGYDLYIFEHTMPEVTPTDGVVIFSDPDSAPDGCGFTVGSLQTVSSDSTLANGQEHPITQYTDPSRITIAQYRRILSSEGYDELFYYNGEPVLLAKNEQNAKIVVLAVDLNRSNLSMMIDFPIMISNLFNYYIPATLTQNSFEVGETVTLNARGENLSVDSPAGKTDFTELPASFVATLPGDYTVTQTNMSGAPIVDQFFVHIPNKESNISRNEERLPTLYSESTEKEANTDLIIWFASAALALLLVEWLLHSRETF